MRHTLYSLVKDPSSSSCGANDHNMTPEGCQAPLRGHDKRDINRPPRACQGVESPLSPRSRRRPVPAPAGLAACSPPQEAFPLDAATSAATASASSSAKPRVSPRIAPSRPAATSIASTAPRGYSRCNPLRRVFRRAP